MSNLNGKPNFGNNPTTGTVNTNTGNGGSNRTEAGAIWTRTSNSTGKEFLTIRLKATELETLLTNAKTNGQNDINLIAFTNNKNGVDTRPDFRIFEELKR